MTVPTDTAPSPAATGPVPSGGRGRWAGVRRALTAGAVGIVVALALFTLGPRVLPYRVWYVRSGSMAPAMPVGSLAVFRPVSASELGKGDVIAFFAPDRPGELVSHRIVRVESGSTGRAFVTRGDANGRPDAWRVPARGTGWHAVAVVPLLGYPLGVLTVPSVRLGAIAVVALVASGAILVEVWRPRRELPA